MLSFQFQYHGVKYFTAHLLYTPLTFYNELYTHEGVHYYAFHSFISIHTMNGSVRRA